MGISPFKSRGEMTKDALKELCIDAIDKGDILLVMVHEEQTGATRLCSNLHFVKDRLGLKGLVSEAKDVINSAVPLHKKEVDINE